MPNIKTEIHDQEVQDAYERLIELGEEPDALLRAIGRQMKTNVQLGFTTGTRSPRARG